MVLLLITHLVIQKESNKRYCELFNFLIVCFFRHSLLVIALRLTQKFAQIYSELPTYEEVFSPFRHLCNWFSDDQCTDVSPLVKELATKIMNVLKENNSKPKKRLNFGPKRPKLLRLYDPKIQFV